jgi:D-lyxose ketol-isomerase
MWHSFWAAGGECIIGEVSTANDDLNDNFFLDPGVGRFPAMEEDEPAAVGLVSDRT